MLRLTFLPSLRRSALPVRTASIRTYASSFRPGPSPPKLPADEQAEFERLQRQAAVSSAFNPPPATEAAADAAGPAESKTDQVEEDGEEINQGIFRGAKPEFKGDVNPKTGEVGGPKNEPLRWGSTGEWTYNGRATDF